MTERLPQNKGLDKIELSVERFTLPELLFHPNDVGLQQTGIAETLMHVVSDIKTYCPQANVTSNANIICVGGNIMFPNFNERL